jgi:molybdenum cofactor biosynthesis enzyme MoaA
MEKFIYIVDYHQRKNNNHILGNKNVTGVEPCIVPWQTLIINQYGLSYICQSPAWLPRSIGSILDHNNYYDFINSHEARSIRQEMLDGTYYYCNQRICAVGFQKSAIKFTEPDSSYIPTTEFNERTIVHQLPKEIVFDFDYTCNFECPSCRTELINTNNGPIYDVNKQLVEKIKKLILDEIKDEIVVIRWAGGEPFISKAYQELWQYIIKLGKPNIRNIIQTNGSYFHKRQEILESFLPYIDSLRISFDAGSSSTYAVIRKNGNWETLLENCQIVKNLRDKLSPNTKLISDFVVQLNNFEEISQYIDIVTNIGFDIINLGKMWNWGTWPDDVFNSLNVSDSKHPRYNEFKEIFNNQITRSNKVVGTYWQNA